MQRLSLRTQRLTNCDGGGETKAEHNASLNSCAMSRGGPTTEQSLLEFCERHERGVVLTARALRRPLLVLDATWKDDEKWWALDRFLGTSPAAVQARRQKHGAAYPHVWTKACNKTLRLKPQPPIDRNADLFARVTPKSPVLWPQPLRS